VEKEQRQFLRGRDGKKKKPVVWDENTILSHAQRKGDDPFGKTRGGHRGRKGKGRLAGEKKEFEHLSSEKEKSFGGSRRGVHIPQLCPDQKTTQGGKSIVGERKTQVWFNIRKKNKRSIQQRSVEGGGGARLRSSPLESREPAARQGK